MNYMLGKKAAKLDPRTFRFASLLPTVLPAIPDARDVDSLTPGIPLPMFANDNFGDCVIAGRAHQTLRFEKREQGRLLAIHDAAVLREYFSQTGGPDSGLVVLDSLNLWRKRGWKVGRKLYNIAAFAAVDSTDPANTYNVKAAIHLLTGAGLGISLPMSANTQLRAGQVWDVVAGPSSEPNSWGGHYVWACGYDAAGVTVVTWGQKQKMTWAFFFKYCDECYGVIDDIDTWLKRPAMVLNIPLLETYLQSVKG